jgi:hypothetical protein
MSGTYLRARGHGMGRRNRSADHLGVDDKTPSPDSTPPSLTAARRLKDLQRLLEEMQELHAQLEYLRLMLKLGAQPRK